MEKLIDLNALKRDRKDSGRMRHKASLNSQNNNIIKCFMHQPIVNNFINISHEEPARIKTSVKE